MHVTYDEGEEGGQGRALSNNAVYFDSKTGMKCFERPTTHIISAYWEFER